MVATTTPARTGPDPALVARVFERITARTHRFVSVDDRGRLTVRLDRLAELVTEYITEYVTEHTEALRAELDAANDAVTELIAQLDDAMRGGVVR